MLAGIPASAEVPAIVQKYAARYAENSADAAAWNRLERAAVKNHLLLWRFNPDVPVTYELKDGKGTIVIRPTSLNSEKSSHSLAAWMTYALIDGLPEKELEEFEKSQSFVCGCPKELSRFAMRAAGTARVWHELKEKTPGLHDVDLDFLEVVAQRGDTAVLAYVMDYRPETPDAAVILWATEHRDQILRFLLEIMVIPEAHPPAYAKAFAERSAAPHENSSFQPAHNSSRSVTDRRKSAEDRRRELEDELHQSQEKPANEEGRIEQALIRGELAMRLHELGRDADARREIAEALRSLRPAQSSSRILPVLLLDVIRASIESVQSLPLDSSSVQAALRIIADSGARETYIQALRTAAEIYATSGRYGAAAKWLQESYRIAKTIGSVTRQSQALLSLARLYDDVYSSICWNISTGRVSGCKATDFSNDGGIDANGNNYGTRSPEEDSATFGTAYTGQQYVSPDQRQYGVNLQARTELADGNLVLALKCLYWEYLDPVFSIAVFMDDTSDFTVNGVSIPARRLMASIFAQRLGNPAPQMQVMKDMGLLLEEEQAEEESHRLAAVPPNGGPLEFGEVESRIAKMRSSDQYVSGRLVEIEKVFREARDFLLEEKLDAREMLEALQRKH